MALRKKRAFGKETDRTNVNEQHKIGDNLNFQTAEAYKLLRTNLEFSFADDKKCRIIGVTSAMIGEGKSLTTINIAHAIASNKKKVLVLEADFRKPTIASMLGMSNENVGLTDYLVSQEIKAPDILIGVRISEEVKFDLAPTGKIPPNPAELLDSNKLKEFLEVCSEGYDYILIDLPPVTVVADALIASKHIDGMVVVVRQNHSDQKALTETMRQLKFSNTRILGFVFNAYNQSKSGYGRKYSNKGYYGEEYAASLPDG